MRSENRDLSFTVGMIFSSVLAFWVATAIFLTYPQLDLIIHRWFFDADAGFIMKQYSFFSVLRRTIMICYGIWYAYIVVGIFASTHPTPWMIYRKAGFDTRQWVYLVLCSIAGPLLLANIILKDYWGRARPRQIEEFGGSLEFGPPVLWSDQCDVNCSFISGEASSMFMIFASLAFVLPAHRKLMLWLMLVLGMISGILRMGLGGHFFSDVIFAGILMSLVAGVLHWLMFRNRTNTRT